MTPRAQQIAIAEACGREGPFVSEMEWFEDGDSDGQVEVLRDAKGCRVWDYPNDLQGMWYAEETLDDAARRSYSHRLCEIIGPRGYDEWSGLFDFMLAHATAAQRAEAFLKAINKWRDDQ